MTAAATGLPVWSRAETSIGTGSPTIATWLTGRTEIANIPRPITAEPRPLTTRLEGSITSTSSVNRRS